MSPDIGPSSASPPAGERVSDSGRQHASRPGVVTGLSVAAALAYPFLAFWLPAQRQPGLGLLLFLPPVCVNLGLAWFFGRTLTSGREALITRFARLEHGQPEPRIMAYTRRLTWVWVAFFLIMAAISVALAASSAREAWVWFTAIGNYLCVAALFAIEYGYRRWRFPRKDHVSPRQQLLMLRAAFRKQCR